MYENPRSDETMYTSYRKSRSHSTTDLSRSVEDNYSRCPPGYTTLSRTNRLPAVQSTAKSPLKRTQSYLTEEVRREFECGYMSTSAPRNTTVSPLQLIRQKKQLQQTQEHSPLPAYGSNNFVKKLVATLEKKQEEPVQEATTGNQRRGCEYASLSIVEARVTSPPVPPRHVPINRFRESCSSGFQNKQVKGGQTFNRYYFIFFLNKLKRKIRRFRLNLGSAQIYKGRVINVAVGELNLNFCNPDFTNLRTRHDLYN